MTLLFFLILTAAWVVIFFPKAIGARRRSPLPAAEIFKKRLELLAPHPQRGRSVFMPEDPRQARRDALRRARSRKKKLLVLLLAAAVILLPASLVWPPLWKVQLSALGSLAAYVVILVGSRHRREEMSAKVKPLPTTEPFDWGAERERATGGAR